ncbi:hypothetical protein DPX16_16712 [Anabarilius grahami]|uniref:Uncharacterized protein n=1 Tax=Anabarilius grahami TaxID=495550 RepID=A0A3N0YSB2_ANAGA|nr:hypothetical protein DPX16_16712 [Anabarilius grahami]
MVFLSLPARHCLMILKRWLHFWSWLHFSVALKQSIESWFPDSERAEEPDMENTSSSMKKGGEEWRFSKGSEKLQMAELCGLTSVSGGGSALLRREA